MLLKGLLLVIDDVAVLNFCRQSEERIMAEVRFCAHVLVVSWTYYLNIVLASTTIERMEMMMPKMNFTIPNMTSPTMQRAIYPNQATKVMRVEPTAESNLHQVCVMLMFVVI